MSDKSVLVVEDSDIDQHIISFMLQKLDPKLKVLQAFDGQEALEILNELVYQPSIIFLDINMPRMNGIDFLKAYETSHLEKTTVVMLSSSSQEKDKKQCFQFKSVKLYIEKPINISDLISVLKSNNSQS